MITEKEVRKLLKTSTTGVRGMFQAIDHDIVKMLCESWLKQREALKNILDCGGQSCDECIDKIEKALGAADE